MFRILKKKTKYPVYVSKNNSDIEKHVILLVITNGEGHEAKSKG